MKRYLAILLIAAAVLSGCLPDQINKTMKSWMGHSETELVGNWGPPTNTYIVDSSTKILSWYYTRDGTQVAGSAWTDSYGVVHYTAPQNVGGYTAKRTFTITNGTIVSWSWEGY